MRNDIETVVFDLDGTIYQNTVFHHDYLHFLVEGTCYECWQQKLVEFTEQVYAGKRLHMNSFYTLKRLNCQTPKRFSARWNSAFARRLLTGRRWKRRACFTWAMPGLW